MDTDSEIERRVALETLRRELAHAERMVDEAAETARNAQAALTSRRAEVQTLRERLIYALENPPKEETPNP